MKTRRFEERLRCELTAAELTERAHQMAKNLGALERVKDEKAETNSTLNASIKELNNEIKLIAREIRERSVERHVVCVEEPDFAAKMMRQYRTDTGEEFHARPMTEGEKQVELLQPASEEPTEDVDLELSGRGESDVADV